MSVNVATNVIIYGADGTDDGGAIDIIDNQTPSKSNVEDVVSHQSGNTYTITDPFGVNAEPVLESEEIVFINNTRANKINSYRKWKITTQWFDYPATSTDFDTFYPEGLLNNLYHWVYFNDYTIRSHTASDTIACNITSFEVEHDYDRGQKQITIELTERL